MTNIFDQHPLKQQEPLAQEVSVASVFCQCKSNNLHTVSEAKLGRGRVRYGQNMSRRAQSTPPKGLHRLHGSHGRCGERSGAKGGARDLGGDCGNPTAHGWKLQPATALLVEERHNNEALNLLASCCCDVQSAENPRTSHDPDRALFSLYRQRPSGSLELGPRDPATSRNSPACIVRMRGPKLLTSSPSSPGAQLRLLRWFPSRHLRCRCHRLLTRHC